MKPIDWKPIFRKYPGKWVALKEDEETVISVANTAKEAFTKAKKSGVRIPILLKVPIESIPYVGQLSPIG